MSNLTHHASVRSQQRGIDPLIIDLVLTYGRVTRKRGANSYDLDGASRKSMMKGIGRRAYKRLEPMLDVFVVEADSGDVITVAPRNRRLKR
jgi:hypothetical protein